MKDYFFFLRQSWEPAADAMISLGEKVCYFEEKTALKISITPETAHAGKVYFSKGVPNTHHFHSAEGLVDVLIKGLRTADIGESATESIINEILAE
jgi:hypothetical protein